MALVPSDFIQAEDGGSAGRLVEESFPGLVGSKLPSFVQALITEAYAIPVVAGLPVDERDAPASAAVYARAFEEAERRILTRPSSVGLGTIRQSKEIVEQAKYFRRMAERYARTYANLVDEPLPGFGAAVVPPSTTAPIRLYPAGMPDTIE